MRPESRPAALIALGAVLFTLGLLTGFLILAFTNPRMGVAAHLEGVMNGIFLIALGAVWHRVRVPARAEGLAFWLLAYGSVANWLFVVLAATFGTSRITPIAGAGYAGHAWQEMLVSVGLGSVGVTMLVGMIIVSVGLVRSCRPAAA